MKTIIIYSGKGGVGKTTTTVNIARMLASKGKSVYILDADVNTPSIHSIIKDRKGIENITAQSTGYEYSGVIYLQGSLIRSYINDCIKEIKELEPDYVLIDTPPSITDVHISIMKKLKISAVIAVTQPTAISLEDVKRTINFFCSKDVTLIGVVQNMVGKTLGKALDTLNTIGVATIAKIPFQKKYNDFNILESPTKLYEPIYKYFEDLNAVILEVKQNTIILDTTTEEDLKNSSEISTRGTFRGKNLGFINVDTWDWVIDYLQLHGYKAGALTYPDMFLLECTTERIKRLLDGFAEDDEIFVRITRAPTTVVKLIVGEVGKCKLVMGLESYYGVPRVQYETTKGTVTLFPYEVMPVTPQDIQLDIAEGAILTKDGRYIPSKETIEQIYNAFGSRVGLFDNWEEIYDSVVE